MVGDGAFRGMGRAGTGHMPGGLRSPAWCDARVAALGRAGMVVDRCLIGLWLGVDRLKIAKDGRCTACTAVYRFGGGRRVEFVTT